MGSDAVESAGSAGNDDTTLPSAKAWMIQSVGVHLLWLVTEHRRLLDKMEEETSEWKRD